MWSGGTEWVKYRDEISETPYKNPRICGTEEGSEGEEVWLGGVEWVKYPKEISETPYKNPRSCGGEEGNGDEGVWLGGMVWGQRSVVGRGGDLIMFGNTTALRLTLKVLNFWKFTSYCSLKPLWSGMGEVVPTRTSPTLHPPSPPTVHQLSRLAL